MTDQRTLDEDEAIVGPAPWAAPDEDAPSHREPKRQAAAPGTSSEPVARRSLSGRLLLLLVVLLIGLGAGLFGGPRLAPMLPGPVAALLAPAQQGVDAAALESLRQTLTARIAELESAVSEAQRESRTAADTARQAQEQATAAREAASGPQAGTDGSSARLDAMQTEIDALAEALATGGGGASPPSAVLRDLQAEIDALSAAVERGDGNADAEALQERVAAVEAQLTRDIAAREEALDAAGDAQRTVAVTAALAEIDRAMALGQPFGPALDNLAEASGVEPPEVLATAAQEGVATREALLNGFNPAAYDAVAEGLAAKEAEGVGGVLARVQARFTGIPAEPAPGPGIPAILSRARHALLEGDIDAALAELADLPEPAQAAMTDWIDQARLRHAADTELHQLRVRLGESY